MKDKNKIKLKLFEINTKVSKGSCSFQDKGRFELQFMESKSTTISGWHEVRRMAVIESPVTQTVLYGRRTESSPCSLVVIQEKEKGKFVEIPRDYPCEHVNNNSGLFVVLRERKELLLVSCLKCRNIKLLDTETMQVKTETKISKHYDDFCVWPGPDDTVFVVSNSGKIWQFDSSFKLKKKFDYELGPCDSVCYLAPYSSLAVRQKCELKTVSLLTRKCVYWKKKYKQKLPNDLFFSVENDILVVSDPKKPQVHVLNPTSGEFKQTIELDKQNIKAILATKRTRKDELVMILRGHDQSTSLSFYSLTTKKDE